MALAKPLFARHTATWKVVHGYIEEQIVVGRYPVGSWLPSVRQLALELGINRNTIAKAYQTLGRSGLVQLVHGNGVRVVGTKPATVSDETRVAQQIEAVVREARRHGLSREWLADRFEVASDDAYAYVATGIGFVECTEQDAHAIGDDLARHLGADVRPFVLGNLGRVRVGDLNSIRFLATTVPHLRELTEIVGRRPIRIVGINFVLSHESAISIARIPKQASVGVVGPNEHTLERVVGIVESLAHGDTHACTTEDPAELRGVVGRADVIVDVALTHAAVKRLRPDARTITVDFHIEPESMEQVRNALHEAASSPATPSRLRQN